MTRGPLRDRPHGRNPGYLDVIHVAADQGRHGGWSALDKNCPHVQILGGKYSEFCRPRRSAGCCPRWEFGRRGLRAWPEHGLAKKSRSKIELESASCFSEQHSNLPFLRYSNRLLQIQRACREEFFHFHFLRSQPLFVREIDKRLQHFTVSFDAVRIRVVAEHPLGHGQIFAAKEKR